MAERKRINKNIGKQYKPRKSLGIDLAQDISDHAQELLWGQGFNFTHEDEKANDRLQELLEYNKASEMLPYNEKVLSLKGNTFMTIDMVDGNPTWTIADPSLNSNTTGDIPNITSTMFGVGRAMVTDVVAVIWKRITYGTITFPVKEIWDRKKVKRIFFGETNKQVKLNVVNKTIPKELQLTEEWEHNMGFVPVVWFKNLPVFNAVSPEDGYKGESLQMLVDKTLQELYHETESNRTRIYADMGEEQHAAMVKNGDLQGLNMQDFIVNVTKKNSTGADGITIAPLIADPKFEAYWKSINSAKDEYYKLAGYSPLGDGNTEKTATENILMKTGDYQVTKKKRNLRSNEINELLYKTLKIDAKHGFGDIYGDISTAVSVEILENKVMDSLHEMQNYKAMIDNDLMSRVEAIAKFRGITKEEAEAVFKDILEQKKAYAEATSWEQPEVVAEGKEVKDKGDEPKETKE